MCDNGRGKWEGGGGGRGYVVIICSLIILFSGGWCSSETFSIPFPFHFHLHFCSCEYKFHSVLVTKCCLSPSFLLSWTPDTSVWIRSFCYYRWPSLLIVTLVMTNNIFAYVLWSRENELCVCKHQSLKGLCSNKYSTQAWGILCTTLKWWAALSILLSW